MNNSVHKVYSLKDGVYLTRQEMECLEGFLRNRTVGDISSDLGLKASTVKNYLAGMKKRFRTSSEDEFVGRLIDIGYLTSVDFRYEDIKNSYLEMQSNCG